MVEPESIRVMQGTAQPWVWSGWTGWWRRELRDRADRYQRRRARIRLQEVTDLGDLNWRLRPHGAAGQEISAHAAFYTPNQIRQIIRWEAGLGSPGAITPPPGWPRDAGRSWRPWPDATHIKLESRPTTGVSHNAPTGWWEGAGRGLPLGAALLAAILLLLRAADRCLHTNLFKIPIRRRQSEEWPTPNVMATSLAVRMNDSTRPDSPVVCTDRVDLPPPYFECALNGGTADTRQKPDNEEPPPPYSACYVAYSNPKDGPATVHFFTSQCQDLFANYEAGPSRVHDTGQTAGLQHSNVEETVDESGAMKEDREDTEVVEMVSNEADVGSVVDSEVEIRENSSRPLGRYRVV